MISRWNIVGELITSSLIFLVDEGKFIEDNLKKIISSSLHQCFLPVENFMEDTTLLTIALLKYANNNLRRGFKELGKLQNADPATQRVIGDPEFGSQVSKFLLYDKVVFHRDGDGGEWNGNSRVFASITDRGHP